MFTPFLSSVKFRALLVSLFLLSSHLSAQWITLNSGTTTDLYWVSIAGNSIVLASGKGLPPDLHGEILRTSDAGATWSKVLYDTTYRPHEIVFVNQQTGFNVGAFYSSQANCYKTTDAGITWDRIYFYQSNSSYARTAVCFINLLTGFSAGYSCGISTTTDGGLNWVDRFSLPSTTNLFKFNSICMSSTSTGWCVGDSGRIVRTINGGLNWTIQPQFTSVVMRCVRFTDVNTGYIAGDSSKIFKTTNSGVTWFEQYSGTNQNLKSIHFVNASTGFICGGMGTVLKTTNSGNTWYALNTGVWDTLQCIKFIGSDTGYAVGNNGRIIKTVTGGVIGITQISSNIPKQYALEQNYPNPFNPSTEIKFDIAKSGIVKLSVFDVLGNSVGVIVNEVLSPGIYKTEWNASGYASGVYFYRLETSDYSLTKKMTLLK